MCCVALKGASATKQDKLQNSNQFVLKVIRSDYSPISLPMPGCYVARVTQEFNETTVTSISLPTIRKSAVRMNLANE